MLQEIDWALLPFFTTAEACTLRLVCRQFCGAVLEFPWEDTQTPVAGSARSWRACFKRARCATLGSTTLTDEDLQHFAGLRRLSMVRCRLVTDAGLAHLRGVEVLDLGGCSQRGLTAAALAPLAGALLDVSLWRCVQLPDEALAPLRGSIERLNISCCPQLTGAALAHLRGTIRALRMWDCPGVSGEGFVHLRGTIQELIIDGCAQESIDDAAFAHLAGSLRRLSMRGCSQDSLSAAGLGCLKNLQELRLDEASAGRVTDAALAALGEGGQLHTLAVPGCAALTDAAFGPLAPHLRALDASHLPLLTDAAFVHFTSLKALFIRGCEQRAITDAAFAHLGGLELLDMGDCFQDTITDAAFAGLKSLQRLCMAGCTQDTITDAAFAHLRHGRLHTLDMSYAKCV